eukprot:6273565-Amphidinium_carterae.1
MYCTLEDKADKLFDISTALPSSNSAVVLTDGLTTQDKLEGMEPHWEHRGKAFGVKLEREKTFPLEVFQHAFN